MTPKLQYSRNGLKLTEQFEGIRLTAYQDQGGKWTIGYGHTAGVHARMTCTQTQAEAWLLCDVQEAVNAANRLILVLLTQCEFDAVVDFIFNVGQGNFAESTILRLLNAGDFEAAACQFEHWDLCDGKIIAGLLRRREAGKQEFLQ